MQIATLQVSQALSHGFDGFIDFLRDQEAGDQHCHLSDSATF